MRGGDEYGTADGYPVEEPAADAAEASGLSSVLALLEGEDLPEVQVLGDRRRVCRPRGLPGRPGWVPDRDRPDLPASLATGKVSAVEADLPGGAERPAGFPRRPAYCAAATAAPGGNGTACRQRPRVFPAAARGRP